MIDAAQMRDAEKQVRQLVRRILLRTHDVDYTDDIIQETYLRLHLARHNTVACPSALMMTIARNLAIDFIRTRTTADRLISKLDFDALDELVGPVNIERSCIAWDELRLISEFANTLSDRQREAFVLMQVLGYSQCEAALKMQPPTTPDAVESLMNVVGGRKGWRQYVAAYKNESY